MSHAQIVRDVEDKVCRTVQDTMRREMMIAQQVMSGQELSLTLIRLAKGMVCTAAGTISGLARSPDDCAALYDWAIETIFTEARAERPVALAKNHALHAEAAR